MSDAPPNAPAPGTSGSPPSADKPAASSPTDETLIASAQRGDADAFAALYDRHAPLLFALAKRMLGSESDARDLLQDVFIEAWRRVRAYDSERASVRTWLLVRTRSRALDRMDRRLREASAMHVLSRSGRAGSDSNAGQLDHHLAVRNSLAALDDALRKTLELTFYAGLTATEIAARMNVPEGTVRSRLARGLRQLAKRLHIHQEGRP